MFDLAIRLIKRQDITYEAKKVLMGGEGENRFYLVKSFQEGKSLLQYIVDNGSRMMKQREDLLDVLAKHVERVDSEGKPLDQKQIELNIINNLKLGLPSSDGLTECIKILEDKFQWGKMKARGMIASGIIVNLMSLALYVLDVYTDGQFVGEMLDSSRKNFTILQTNCTTEFYYKIDEGNQHCNRETGTITRCIDFFERKALKGQKCREIGPRFEDPNKFTECFWYSLAHCIAPIIWTFFVFLMSMKVSNIKKIPFPPITRIVKAYQDTQMLKMRARVDFKNEVPKMEARIAKYEDSVNLSSAIDAATEASPQFFFQTVYILPNLILNLVRSRGLQELVSYKMFSIAFSFTSVAVSNYFIR